MYFQQHFFKDYHDDEGNSRVAQYQLLENPDIQMRNTQIQYR